MKPFLYVLSAILLLILPRTAFAHDVWLTLDGEATSRRVIVNYGHPDDRPPAFADKVIDLVAVGEQATTSLRDGLASQQRNGIVLAISRPFVDDRQRLFAARYDNGIWTRTRDGEFRNATRRLVADAVETIWSAKFAKAVSGSGAPFTRVLGHDLELVPLTDPALAKPGDTLKLRILFHGKPLSGANVERGDGATALAEDDIPRFATDTDGVAAVPIVKAGAQLLVVDHRAVPSAAPEQADVDLFNATLWFRAAAD